MAGELGLVGEPGWWEFAGMTADEGDMLEQSQPTVLEPDDDEHPNGPPG